MQPVTGSLLNNKSYSWHKLLPWLWALLILVLTVIPGRDLPRVDIWQWDKIAHFVVYTLLVLFILYGYKRQYDEPELRYKVKWFSVFVAIGYGILMELIQGLFMADRTFDIVDIVANTLGCLAGLIIFTNLYTGLSVK